LHRCTFVLADEYLFGFLLLTPTLYFQLGSGSGIDVIKYLPAVIPARNTWHRTGNLKIITAITTKHFNFPFFLKNKSKVIAYSAKAILTISVLSILLGITVIF
jgi:hypothetical protein